MTKTEAKIKTIVLGLSLSENEEGLVKFATNMADSLGSKLVLSHVIRPFHYYAYAGEAPVFPVDSYGPVVDELDETHALKKLDAIKASIHDSLQVELRICHQEPAEGLEEIGSDLNADLILVGSDYSPSMWQGVSTSISLMKYSDRPVLVVPNKAGTIFEKDLSIFCGDDLSQSCERPTLYALSLAEALRAKTMRHFNIRDMSEEDINRMIEHVRTAAVLGKITEDVANKVEHYREKIVEETQRQLNLRMSKANSNISIRQEVYFGKVNQVLSDILSEDKDVAKLLVFGKHHIFHTKSFSLGKVPYPTMLQQGVAVLVVP